MRILWFENDEVGYGGILGDDNSEYKGENLKGDTFVNRWTFVPLQLYICWTMQCNEGLFRVQNWDDNDD